jgi:hypothetical protein
VSPVKYELGFYIPEDDILHSYCRENIKSCILQCTSVSASRTQARFLSRLVLLIKQTPWPLVRERTIPTERPPLVDEI